MRRIDEQAARSRVTGPARAREARAPRVAGAIAVSILALSLANCTSTSVSRRNASEAKYGVPSSPRVIPEGQPIPKGGGRDMIGKPYVVAGRTYIPHPGRGYDREGWASWYGTAFHGRLTANGEIFDRDSIAAAHPTLPLPCYVRVTNLVNKRSMIVRVNDRGPYEQDRVIDLSERAADALGFHRKGTGRVRVQYVGRASLAGSDDQKLLASLRTDGLPAMIEAPRVMLAKAEGPKEPERPPPELKIRSAALQGAKSGKGKDDEPPSMRRPSSMSKPADGKPIRAARLDDAPAAAEVLPPRRPDLRSGR